MKTAKTLVAALVVLAVYACAPAPAPTEMATAGTPADEQAIRDLMERVETAWNTKDAAAMSMTVTDDWQGISPDGKHTMGRAAYEENLKTEFAEERPEGMALSIEVGYIQWHGADVAAVGGTYSVSGLPEGVPSTGSWLSVVERSGGQWQSSNGLVARFVPETGGGN
jgi:uncharacterized protein (TIGR02246 family)